MLLVNCTMLIACIRDTIGEVLYSGIKKQNNDMNSFLFNYGFVIK